MARRSNHVYSYVHRSPYVIVFGLPLMIENSDDLFEEIDTQLESTIADRGVGGRGLAERQRGG